MINTFITVSNGEITGIHGGDIDAVFTNNNYKDHERIIIPDNVSVTVGDRLVYYDSDWNRKPDLQLMIEGLIPVPEGYLLGGNELRSMTAIERIAAGLDELQLGFKIENGEIIPMTAIERILAGLDEIPKGFKLEGGQIIEMSVSKKMKAGLITQEQLNEILTNKNLEELRNRLSGLYKPLKLLPRRR